MAQFVIIRGPVNSGKSTTTQLVYKYLAPMANIGSQHLFRYRMENHFDVLESPEVPKYVSGNSPYDFPSSVDEVSTQDNAQVQKLFCDGQVYILRGGKTYTLTGVEVK